MLKSNPLSELSSIFTSNQIKTLPEDLLYYGRDWTTYYDIQASAVVFPETVEQLQSLVLWAQKQKIGLVPSGGRTGLSGGACAIQGEVVVSFEKMNRILDFDPIEQTVVCQAGVITEQLQHFAKEKNLQFPVDFAARGSSQIGGNIATNAGGIKVLRYGMTRQWVTGLDVVTGQGQVLHLNNNLIKNATGPNFLGHFIGSEGIFGFIYQATLQLTSPSPRTEVLLLQVPTMEAIMSIYAHFRSQTTLQAFEFFSQKALNYVLKHKGDTPPFPNQSPFYLVVEAEAPHQSHSDTILQVLEQIHEQGYIQDGALAQNSEQARQFWGYRENISECLAPHHPYKNDISVRISAVPAFVAKAESLLQNAYPEWEVVWFGHIGDGNLHINILRPAELNKEQFVSQCQTVDQKLFQLIADFKGAISAEHGVGLSKKPFLGLSRSPEELTILRQMKHLYDPAGIMNPGKVIDL